MEKEKHEYKLDLSRAGRAGDFKCPNCRVEISPDDQSESVYSIKGVKTRHNTLVELLIQCNGCRSLIRLTGFNMGNLTGAQPARKAKVEKKKLPHQTHLVSLRLASQA